jgi:hypothetical protein
LFGIALVGVLMNPPSQFVGSNQLSQSSNVKVVAVRVLSRSLRENGRNFKSELL